MLSGALNQRDTVSCSKPNSHNVAPPVLLGGVGAKGGEVVVCLHHASKFTNTLWDIRHIGDIRVHRAAC